MVNDRRERGQLILIGAITLAFIILGIVVVFNGVLYTETLSSGPASQSAADANVTELEIKQGVACLLEYGGEDVANVTAFNDAYRKATVNSTPDSVNISNINTSSAEATVTITYVSSDFSYKKNRTISESDCRVDP